MRKYGKCLAKGLWWLALAATAVMLVSVLGAKFQGKVPQLFGYSILRIVSGSMEPQIQTGAYILVKHCSPEEVAQGDIISYYSRDYAIYGQPNTHRVIQPPQATASGYRYITQGDNNAIPDELAVESEQLIGKYVGTVDWLTAFSRALEKGLLVVLLVLAQVGTIGAILVPMLFKE